MKKRVALIGGALIVVVLGLVVLIKAPSGHLVGDWDCRPIPISIYKDGVASFSGMKANWSEISADAIRLEYGEGIETAIMEFRLDASNEQGVRTATYGLASLRTKCKESKKESGK